MFVIAYIWKYYGTDIENIMFKIHYSLQKHFTFSFMWDVAFYWYMANNCITTRFHPDRRFGCVKQIEPLYIAFKCQYTVMASWRWWIYVLGVSIVCLFLRFVCWNLELFCWQWGIYNIVIILPLYPLNIDLSCKVNNGTSAIMYFRCLVIRV